MVKIVTSWQTLFTLAKAVGNAEIKYGKDSEQHKEAVKQLKEYEEIVKQSDSMML
jgi:hypothetical protein